MDIAQSLPLWSIVPFAGMLLSIALFPLVKPEWWDRHQLLVSIIWSALFLVPFFITYGSDVAIEHLSEVIVGDYIPFIVLLLGLFIVSGGINIKGTIVGTTKNNVAFLVIGTLLASWIGTTGAAMLLIRPLLRANSWRKYKAHIVIVFIFLVANIGGCLTPLGDPPLFLGYLRGIPFFWTCMHIWPLLLLNTVILIAVFVLIDRHYVKREGKEGRDRLELMDAADERVPIRIDGWHNLFLLALIIVSVILNGTIPQIDLFIEQETGLTYGISVFGTHVGIEYIVQVVLIALASVLSWVTTSSKTRKDNKFKWAPIAEVAKLFIGIFITMIPALMLLGYYGKSLGESVPSVFFWATGLLSSFLDNSPTFVVFLTAAGAAGSADPAAVATSAGVVDPTVLLAISAGAVFMGAMTYIGNAPNFMVKNIAESSHVKMPNFFKYMAWSAGILVPIFVIDTIVFFL